MSALKNNTDKIQSLIEQANSLPAKTDGAVSYKVSQNLTEEEKNLARENIGAAKNEHYALIETVTFAEAARLDRTVEPDGTPYNFDAVFFHVWIPSGEKVTSGSFFFYKNRSTETFVHRWTAEHTAATDAPSSFAGRVYRDKGVWCWYLPAEFRVNANSPLLYDSARTDINDYVNGGNLTRLWFTQTFPAGTVINIYGVRA